MQLQAVDLEDVCAAFVEELSVVRDHNAGDTLERIDVFVDENNKQQLDDSIIIV